MTVQQALDEAARHIARRDAEVLLAHSLNKDQAWLIAHADEALSADHHAAFLTLVTRREAREPLQYITGEQEFYGLPLRVTRDTLIPRPETEHLVEAVLTWAKTWTGTPAILDVGTGTGAIALALAQHLPNAHIHACDLSPAALIVAKDNAERLGLGKRIAFFQSDLFESCVGARFDAIVSNPPYVPQGDAAGMQPEVRDFEPHSALFAGDDGLAIYRRLIPQAHHALHPGGLLAMEIGFGQRDALAALLTGWNSVRFLDDYAAIPRVVLASAEGATTYQPGPKAQV